VFLQANSAALVKLAACTCFSSSIMAWYSARSAARYTASARRRAAGMSEMFSKVICRCRPYLYAAVFQMTIGLWKAMASATEEVRRPTMRYRRRARSSMTMGTM